MTDPLLELFGVPALELCRQRQVVVSHGALDRLPPFMRSGALADIDSLCRSYSGQLEVANGTEHDGVQLRVAEAHPSALLRLGLTVYFRDVARALPRAGAWLRQLEAALGLPECAALSAFANAPGSGLPLHHDASDQLLFQIQGRKRFRHAPNRFVEHPAVQFAPFAAVSPEWTQSYRHGYPLSSAELLEQPFEMVELEPGSALFMPAGTWHTTAEQKGDALSVVVVFGAPSRRDVLLNLLRYYTTQSAAWRAPAYGGWGTDANGSREHERFTELLNDLASRLPELRAADAYQALLAHAFSVGTQAEYPLDTRFERYVRIPSSSASFEDDAALGKLRCTVESGPTHRARVRTTLAFNPEARPVLDWILELHAAFSVDSACQRFVDFSRAELEALFAMLTRAGLLRPLPAPEWDRP